MTIATYRRPVSVNRAFNEAFRQLQRDAEQASIATASQASDAVQSWKPAVDIHEYDDRFVLRADVPGVALADIDITIDKTLLTVSGSRLSAPEVEPAVSEAEAGRAKQKPARAEKPIAPAQALSGQAHRIERAAGQFSRQFRLPETVDTEAVTATANLGVIEITVPKAEKPQPRKVVLQPAS